MKALLRILILATIVVALIYCWYNPEIRTAFISFDTRYLPIICLCYFLFYGLNSVALFILARKSSKDIPFLRVVGISQFSSLVGYTLPFRVANIGVRAAYFKSRYKIPLGETIGGGLIVTLMSILMSSITALFFGINYLNQLLHEQLWLVLICCIGIVALLAIAYVFRSSLSHNFSKYFSKLESLKQGVTQLNAVDIILLILVTGATFILTALINFTLVHGAGMQTPLSVCLLLAAVGNLSFLIAIAPANLGTKELFYVGIGTLYGLSAKGVIAFLIIDRLIQITILCLSSLVFYFYEGKPKDLVKY